MAEEDQRIGITVGGNWTVDRVKTVDRLPERGLLGNIVSEQTSTGGAPANVLGDLAALGSPFPLSGVGIVGDDEDGRLILDKFRSLGVEVSHVGKADDARTAYTDVMSEQGTGIRSFFHHRGANALFGPEHVPIEELTCRLFHLGYLLILDSMDRADDEYGTVAARVLHDLREAGIKTSLDVVSEDSDRFKSIVPPALKHVDYLILNEIEAARTVGRSVRGESGELDGAEVVAAVDELHELGSMELVVVHMAEGVYLQERGGKRFSAGSLDVPDGFIKGSVGAGDAFCAGMLYGLHEGWDAAESARLATCCATASLSEPGGTEGLKPLADVIELADVYPEFEPPVEL